MPKTIATTVADGQRITQDVQLAKAVGLEEYESKVTVYPNPARDFVTVEMAVGTEIANIVLYDMHGRIVGTNNYSPLQPTAINVKDLPAGTYFLHILTTDNREIIRKIVHE